MNLTISLAQICIQLGQPDKNLSLARDWTSVAKKQGSQCILFPELWTTGYDLSRASDLAAINQKIVLPELKQIAKENDIWIGGSLLLERDGRVYNTFIFQPPSENERIHYAKIHLFRLMEEDRWLAPGDRLQSADSPWGKNGLAICYDMRFPEMFRQYALDGVSLLLISAEWPAKRIFHWQTLLRARAIENQCFIAATNATGETGGETFGGCSAVISPWGETMVEGKADQPELLTVTIDLTQVSETRQRIPILQDRRPDIYG